MSESQKILSGFDPEKTLYLLDISSFIFRAYFAVRPLTSPVTGEPTQAVYGVATMVTRFIEEAKPQNLAVAYDSKEPSFRKAIYSEYKANRDAPPEDLIPQFARIEELIQGFRIHSFRKAGVEADDLIATLTQRWKAQGPDYKVVVVSGDKDLMQLVDSQVLTWDTLSQKIYSTKEVEEKMGVPPEQVRDYLSLVGDSSDNIPGVPSIGPKSAAELLKQWGSLERILSAAEAGQVAGKKGEVLKQNRTSAELSQTLATLKSDVELPFLASDFKYTFGLSTQGLELFKTLGFHSLVTKWASRVEGKLETSPPEVNQDSQPSSASLSGKFECILSEEQWEKLEQELIHGKEFGFDLETTSLNPREARIVGVALCPNRGRETQVSYYVPIGHRSSTEGELAFESRANLKQNPLSQQLSEAFLLPRLKALLENPALLKIGQNLKYDWSVLREHGIHPCGLEGDTMVASYILNPSGRHNLQTLAQEYLNYSVLTYEEVCGSGKNQISFAEVPLEQATRYSAEDAWIAVLLWEKMKPQLKEQDLEKVYREIDLPLVDLLCRMEGQGVALDPQVLKKLGQDLDQDLSHLEAKILKYANGPLNLNSPKQLAVFLFETLGLPPQGKLKTGYSTDAQTLAALSELHEVPRLLIEYREMTKLKGTYVDPLPGLIDSKTGKIHAHFHQTVAATGRLSSSDPNLQNIPIKTERGIRVREAFIPSAGNCFVSADYSQIELRVLAEMSQDRELCRSFQIHEDVHRRTASEIFGVAPDQVDERMRSVAKAINFGLMYGKSAFALSEELKISRTEAQSIIKKYFERYAGVKRYLDHSIETAREKGFTETAFGRKRQLPEIRSKNGMLRASAERMAMNTPIQGTAADLMKIAMIKLDDRLAREKLQARIVIQVHDEVLIDCPLAEKQRVLECTVHELENAVKWSVPLRVNASVGNNWREL